MFLGFYLENSFTTIINMCFTFHQKCPNKHYTHEKYSYVGISIYVKLKEKNDGIFYTTPTKNDVIKISSFGELLSEQCYFMICDYQQKIHTNIIN